MKTRSDFGCSKTKGAEEEMDLGTATASCVYSSFGDIRFRLSGSGGLGFVFQSFKMGFGQEEQRQPFPVVLGALHPQPR